MACCVLIVIFMVILSYVAAYSLRGGRNRASSPVMRKTLVQVRCILGSKRCGQFPSKSTS